jgi:cytochrome c5
MKRVILSLGLICLCSDAGQALDREQERGKGLLERLCSRCHAIGTTGKSPHADAPPFRTFGEDKLYDNDFGKRLREGLSTIHPDMPTFHFSQEDAEAAVNYLKSIQERRRPR